MSPSPECNTLLLTPGLSIMLSLSQPGPSGTTMNPRRYLPGTGLSEGMLPNTPLAVTLVDSSHFQPLLLNSCLASRPSNGGTIRKQSSRLNRNTIAAHVPPSISNATGRHQDTVHGPWSSASLPHTNIFLRRHLPQPLPWLHASVT